MNKTEKEYYSKCHALFEVSKEYGVPVQIRTECSYFDAEKGRCSLNFCFKYKKERKNA